MNNIHTKISATLKALSGLVFGHITFLVQCCYAMCRSTQNVFHAVLFQTGDWLSKVK